MIRRLTPDLVDDYLHFFDTTPHDDNTDESKCYCVCWCNDTWEGKDFSSAEKRRDLAARYVKDGNIQGYLAYRDDLAVGWCNANTKTDCLRCASMRWLKDSFPAQESTPEEKIKSVFCFVIAKEYQRKGIATRLLERICKDAEEEGFDYVEAYPNRAFVNESADFMGPAELFMKTGFSVYYEAEKRLIMRKKL